MNNYLVLLLAATVLLLLIFNIKTSRRLIYLTTGYHQLVKKRSGYKWQVIAFINDPKLMVVWDVLLAGLLLNEERNLTALWVLGTLGFADISGIILKRLIRRKRLFSTQTWKGYSFPSGHVFRSNDHGANSIAAFC